MDKAVGSSSSRHIAHLVAKLKILLLRMISVGSWNLALGSFPSKETSFNRSFGIPNCLHRKKRVIRPKHALT